MTNSRITAVIITTAIAACAILEVGLRLSGAVDFPLYEIRTDLGIIPAPKQRGNFLNHDDWAFNELSMGVDYPYDPSLRPSTFLIGDSVVSGGNMFRQNDRLGAQLQKLSCSRVWPISGGGWAFVNELRYLRHYQNLLPNIDRIIFVLNSNDFVTGTVRKSELDQPTYRPWLASVYVLRKYVLPRAEQSAPESDTWKVELSWLVNAYTKSIVVALYPSLSELKDAALRSSQLSFRKDQISSISTAITVVNIADDGRLKPSHYRDEIHPTPDGTIALAHILSDTIDECTMHNG